ncbi:MULTISPECIES: CDP-archaeol synthase [Marinobacter]|uniref:CDP-archaeol synthase n=1 Tax=Marinobacter TaxID=2742 RepID=UPI001D17CC9B|nr:MULTISPECIES: CDP-archaeol synthase [Marinobacter]
MSFELTVQLLLLLLAANGSPVLGRYLLGRHGAQPVDGGRLWRDGERLLGDSKTWRGLIIGVTACTVVSLLLGLGGPFGVMFGALALLGDLFSSFIKRRRHLRSSSRATGLDQLPEAILPVGMGAFWLDYNWQEVAVTVLLFMLADMLLSPLLYRLGIRRQPH